MSVDAKEPKEAEVANDPLSALLASAVLDDGAGPAPARPSSELREQALRLLARDATLRARRRVGLWGLGLAVVAALGFATPAFFRRNAQGDVPSVPVANATPERQSVPAEAKPTTLETGVGIGNDPAPRAPITVDVATLPPVRAPNRAPPTRDSKRPTEGASAPAAAEAEDLLRTANRLRGEKQWEEAMRTYERVIREHPSSDPAYAALIAAASLRLSRAGDPREALRLYQRALDLHPGGELSEEALWGTCVAHRALGEQREEREALQRFTTRFPSSWRAAEANGRMLQIGEGPR